MQNDYQLDIALPEDRAAYKRIIDRASELGITHILFSPQNSDVSSQANNTDPWGWEQLLWFGYGQKIRMGEWTPGDPLAPSTQEMLDYFKEKGVKPVAYVYPILAFLAGTIAGGGNPSWIVQGTYMSDTGDSSSQFSSQRAGGILRSNLANEEFIQWLPETMLAFAEQTGAGGFSFDLTYWEETLPVASEFAQWAGWRNILSQLHTKRGGKGCGGSRCVVDNRQANHGAYVLLTCTHGDGVPPRTMWYMQVYSHSSLATEHVCCCFLCRLGCVDVGVGRHVRRTAHVG